MEACSERPFQSVKRANSSGCGAAIEAHSFFHPRLTLVRRDLGIQFPHTRGELGSDNAKVTGWLLGRFWREGFEAAFGPEWRMQK
jgi:hypothetical protein